MYRNVYFQGVQRRPVNQQQNNDYMQNPFSRADYKQYKEISPKTNSAIMAYASPIIQKPYEKMSLNEILTTLRRQGKIEGRDYELEENGDRPWVNVYNKYGQEIFRAEYNIDNGNLLGCETSTFKGNKRLRRIFKEPNGKISMYEDFYYNNEIPQEQFTKEGITSNTSPDEYINYLKHNNINFKVEYSGKEDNNRSLQINEFDNGDKLTQSTWFYYGENKFNEKPSFISRSLYNSKKQEEKRITFERDCTEVCTYNKKCGHKTYDNSDIDVRQLTDVQLTYNTTPEEYLSLINSNPQKQLNVNVKKKAQNTKIEELDSNGNIINSTEWIYENGKFDRICRFEIQNSNNRRRLDFYKNTTEEMKMTYK